MLMYSGLSDLIRHVKSEEPVIARGLVGLGGLSPMPAPVNYTHIGYYGGHGRFEVKNNRLGDFWYNYCKMVYEDMNEDKDKHICLGEKINAEAPVASRFTIRHHAEEKKDEPYGEDFILAVARCYQQAVVEVLEVKDENHIITCVLQTEDFREETTDLPNGGQDRHEIRELLFQFPYIKTDINHQKNHVRPKFIQLLRANNVIARFKYQPIVDWDGMIDNIGKTETFPMYGSIMEPQQKKLCLNYILKTLTDEDVKEGDIAPVSLPLEQYFNPHTHRHVTNTSVSGEVIDRQELEFWKPMFLSVHYCTPITFPKEIYTTVKVAPPSVINPSSAGKPEVKDKYNENPVEMVDKLLSMLSVKRANRLHYWLDIGKALYTCYNGGPEGLDKWARFTDKDDAYGREDCEEHYYSTEFQNSNNLTIKTIAWYAREDDFKAYDAWHRIWVSKGLEMALSTNHTDVAEAVYRAYWLDYVNSNMSHDGWYVYLNHRWAKSQKGVNLKAELHTRFIKRFEEDRIILINAINDSTDESVRATGELRAKKYTTVIGKLKMMPFQQSIMTASMTNFYNVDFNKHIDSNPQYLGMLNGVIETNKDECTFRTGKPEDYITMSSGMRYKDDYTEEHSLVKRVRKWIGQVFVDEDLQKYFYKYCASLIRGRNSDKKFAVFTGETGNNSKSMIQKLLQACFGAFCVDFPVSLLTQTGKNSSGPTPELAQAKGAHIAILSEPDEKEEMKGGLIKRFTGGDRFFARFLNDNGGSIEAMFKMLLICNKVPVIPTGGDAMINRMIIIPFLSQWIKNAPYDEKEQYATRTFPMNEYFENQIVELAPAFMWILVQMFPTYIKEGFSAPKIVKEATENYWKDNDVYLKFVEECIVPANITSVEGIVSRDMTVSITYGNCFAEFKRWFRSNFPQSKVPDTHTFGPELHKKLGAQTARRWYGYKIQSEQIGGGFGI